MSKKVVILQSSYIPWRGYFDLISKSDEFIFYDDVQFTKRDWRTRNKIKTAKGLQWLSIPVKSKGKYLQKINEVELLDSKWCTKHWNAICHSYARAPYFKKFKKNFEDIYQHCNKMTSLSEVNKFIIKEICNLLRINAQFSNSDEYGFDHLNQTERLLAICKSANATTYISGPSAKNYIQADVFAAEGIELKYIDYSNYLPYQQQNGSFVPHLSILDLIFNEGKFLI